jgi:hypothetical protein
MKQSEKYHLSLAGEFYVAAELQRQGVHASVTYGNAKRADIVALSQSGTRAIVIEVKSTGQRSWVIGGTLPESSEKPWVLVYLPSNFRQSPEFFVLTQEQIHNILAPKHEEYKKSYLKKHGREFGGKGVYTLDYNKAKEFVNRWDTITTLINTR